MQLSLHSLSAPGGLPWPPRLDNPRLNRCVTLALLLHILLVLVFGNAPGGTARPGEGVWGSLNVSLIGPRTEPGSGPPSVPNVNAGAVGAAATQRFGGVVREENEAPRPNTPGAARQGNWNVVQGEKLIGEVAEPQPSMVQPQASVIATPEVPVAEILPPVPTEEPAPPPPPAPVLRTLKQAPTQEVQRQASPVRPAAEPRAVAPSLAEAEPVKPLAPLALPAPAPVLRSLTAAPLPVATAEPDRQPQLSRLTPEPSAAALEPMQRMEQLPAAQAQPVEAARPAPDTAPTPTPTQTPAPAATPAATPAAAAAEPVRTVAPERLPSMAPERGAATQAPSSAVAAPSLAPIVGAPDAGARIGRDVATAPSTPASAPRPALNLSLPRGGELSSQGTRGVLQLLPRPPDVKSKLSESIEKAAQADCRKAYSEQGLLAVIPLVRDAARDKGCRW